MAADSMCMTSPAGARQLYGTDRLVPLTGGTLRIRQAGGLAKFGDTVHPLRRGGIFTTVQAGVPDQSGTAVHPSCRGGTCTIRTTAGLEVFDRHRWKSNISSGNGKKKRYIPAVPVIPPIPEPQSRRQLRDSNTPPVSAPMKRPLAPPVWFTPPPMPSGNPNGQPYQYGYPFYPVPLTPPVSPTPPTPPTPPTVGNPNRMPPSGGFMAPPVSPPPRLPRYSDVYQGYGHGNAYTGYSHGNLYEGYGHGGNYYAPEPLSR